MYPSARRRTRAASAGRKMQQQRARDGGARSVRTTTASPRVLLSSRGVRYGNARHARGELRLRRGAKSIGGGDCSGGSHPGANEMRSLDSDSIVAGAHACQIDDTYMTPTP